MAERILRSRERDVIKKWIRKMKQRDVVPANKKDVAKAALNLPFEEIGFGSRRIVYDMKNGYILKVAIVKEGIISSKNEADLYEMVSSSIKRHLAMVKEHGEGWIVMKKAGRQLVDNKENRDKVWKLYKKLDRCGIQADDIINLKNKEPRWHNVRYKKRIDSVIIIDYGDFTVDSDLDY